MRRRLRQPNRKHTHTRNTQHDAGGHKRQAQQQPTDTHSELERTHEDRLVCQLSDRLAHGHGRVQQSDMTRLDERRGQAEHRGDEAVAQREDG